MLFSSELKEWLLAGTQAPPLPNHCAQSSSDIHSGQHRDLERISIHTKIKRREENTPFLLFYIQTKGKERTIQNSPKR